MAEGKAGIDISPKNDGGVIKKILKEGTGDEIPSLGSKVTVHYVGRLTDGTVFDSSRDRNEPFNFDLGKGGVIKAWDIGVATMKKGELAELTCASEYAYGAAGSPPKIPANATLVFEIEMIDWTAEDLSPEKDFSIVRRIITTGEGYGYIAEGALLDVHLVGKHQDKVFDERDVAFNLGEGSESNIIEGLEIALEKFKKGETSKISIKSKYAFANNPNNEFNIPADADVEYTVTLKSFEKAKESWSMDSKERLEHAKLLKEKGTKYFKANKLQLAQKMYKNALKFLEGIEKDFEGAEEKDYKENLVSARLNLALCHLKHKQYGETKYLCNSVIELDPRSEKAYFRLGQAYLGLCEPEVAIKQFEKVLEIDPNNKAAAAQVALSKQRIIDQKAKEKKIYANMFEKFAKKDTEV